MENNLGSTSKTSATTKEFPKRLFGHGKEPEVEKINNSCRLSILRKIKDALPLEYKKVKSDPLFAQVFAIYIYKNSLHYSGRLVHSLMCRQLVTSKRRA
ncbi:predicted protein [Arabidopsis lyrata subsp. lyrata]|uniref:Predicted protein n=1 Tax=Arabidopsis lyrata subsp. lyrata TaxID=81972 RepID=D7MKW6_ARALL|nr:predicted protein [Arabidopsis lyrata subsp. lyrata]